MNKMLYGPVRCGDCELPLWTGLEYTPAGNLQALVIDVDVTDVCECDRFQTRVDAARAHLADYLNARATYRAAWYRPVVDDGMERHERAAVDPEYAARLTDEAWERAKDRGHV
jgi:hypothetical protein